MILRSLAAFVLFLATACQAARDPAPSPPARAELTPVKIDSPEVAANYYQVGQCYLAGQPTEKGFAEAKAKGVKTVLNLRLEDEQQAFDEKKLLEAMSLNYVHLPVSPKTPSDETVDRFLDTLKTAPKPILIHCGSAGRVSGLWAIHLVVDEGISPEEALALAGQSGLKSDDFKAFVRGYLERRKKR